MLDSMATIRRSNTFRIQQACDWVHQGTDISDDVTMRIYS